MKKKVIIYGLSSKIPLREVFLSMKSCFDIVGISDRDEKKGKEYAQNLITTYIQPKMLYKYVYDYIYITTLEQSFPDIYRYLVHELGLSWDKVLYYREFYKEIHLSCGEKNAEKKIYVLRVHPANGGIVTQLVSFLSQLVDISPTYDVFFDLENYTNVYVYGEMIGKKNAWEYWFEQPSGLSSEDVYESQNVILCGCADYYLPTKIQWTDKDWPKIYNDLFNKYVKYNKTMTNIISDEEKRLDLDYSKTCAVIYRGTDYTLLKTYGHPIQPTVKQMIDKVKELIAIWGFETIYLSTEDAKAQECFIDEFGDKVVYSDRELIREYPLKKSKSFGTFDHSALTNVTFDRPNDAFLKGMEYLRQIIFVSKCRFLISGNTGGYWGALIMSSGRFEKEYVFDLGVYGIDDDSYATSWGHYVLVKEERKLEKKRLEENGYI